MNFIVTITDSWGGFVGELEVRNGLLVADKDRKASEHQFTTSIELALQNLGFFVRRSG